MILATFRVMNTTLITEIGITLNNTFLRNQGIMYYSNADIFLLDFHKSIHKRVHYSPAEFDDGSVKFPKVSILKACFQLLYIRNNTTSREDGILSGHFATALSSLMVYLLSLSSLVFFEFALIL